MSAELLTGIAGAAIGFAIGGPQGAMYGYAIGSATGSVLFGPKVPDQEGPKLTNLYVLTSQEGAPIFKVYGSARVGGNVIWGKPLQEHKKKKKAGGKGGGGQKVTTYSYTLDFALGLCEGPITGVVKIWDSGKLILDSSALTDAEQAIVDGGGYLPDAAAKYSAFFGKTTDLIGGGSIRIYSGSETQMPDPLIEADLGAGNAPAYRGLAYIVFDNYPTQQMPNITVEVVVAGSSGPVYLGKVDIPLTNNVPAGGHYEPIAYQIKADRIALGLKGINDTNSTIGTNAPAYMYMSGSSIIGGFVPATGGNEGFASRMAGNFENPYMMTSSGTSSLKMWAITGNPPVYTAAGTYSPADGGFLDSNTNSYPAVSYERGNVLYVLVDPAPTTTTDQILYKTDISNFTDTVYMPVHFDFSGLFLINAFSIAQTECYVLTSTAPYRLIAYDLDSMTELYQVNIVGGTHVNASMRSPVDGEIWILFDNGTDLRLHHVLDQVDYDLGTLPASSGISPNTTAPSNWNVDSGILIFVRNESTAGPWEVRYWSLYALSIDTVPLSTIVADICNSAGLSSGFINVTDLASTLVKGYIRNAQMTARAALEPLMTNYFVDAIESGTSITFRRRGGATVKTIAFDDLGANVGNDPVDRAITTIVQDNELPIELNIQYVDQARDYQVGSQRSRRQIPESQKTSSINVPIVLSATEAKQSVEKLHYTAWEERNQYKISLPIRYLALEPGDPILVPINGFNRRLRITKTQLGNTLECEAVSDFASSYVSEAVAADNPTGPQVIKVPGTTIAVLLDTPLLADADDDTGLYMAAMGTGSGWTGAEIFKSTDGVSYESVDAILSESTIGSMAELLPNALSTIWDDGPAVKVKLLEGTLSSVTDLEAMAGANTAAIGVDGRWEIVSFANAVLNGDGTYSLSRRLRGRKGTEWAAGLHAISDTFVLLEAGDLIRNVPATGDIGSARFYKAISFGGSEEDAITYTHRAVGKKPYAVAHITGRRHTPATNDWTLYWVRRGRVDGDWRDYVDVPLGESSESYEIEIMNGSTVVRTITATAQTAVYTAAQQTTDFGSVRTTLSVRVYQISSVVGRGTVSAGTV